MTIDEFGEAEEDGGVTVVTTTVADGEGVCVGAEGDGGSLRVFAPDSYHTPAADVGVDFVGVELLEVTDDSVVGKTLVAGGLRVLVELVAYLFIINHNVFSIRSYNLILSIRF